MVELRNLEKEFPEFKSKESLTQKVGGHVKEGFEKVTHEIPLQSLQDVFSIEEVEEFDERMQKQAKENNIENYKGFLDNFIKKEKLKELINSIINIFILISFYVMIAGFGAYLEQEINLNSFIGSSILAFLCVILFKTNIKGIVKINEILIPILIAVVLVIRNSKYSKYRYQHFEQPYSFTKK